MNDKDLIGEIAARKIKQFDPCEEGREWVSDLAELKGTPDPPASDYLTEYRAAITEALPVGNTDKLTALVGKLISELAAARKEIADFEASWMSP